MDYHTAFHISASGMAIEKLRVEVTAANLANMHRTSATPEGLYRPMRVIAHTPSPDFTRRFGELTAAGGVQHVSLEPLAVAPRLVHEPGHPHADSKGHVAYPGIDHATEMVNLAMALRAYEANVVAMNAARTMTARTLDIGGQ